MIPLAPPAAAAAAAAEAAPIRPSAAFTSCWSRRWAEAAMPCRAHAWKLAPVIRSGRRDFSERNDIICIRDPHSQHFNMPPKLDPNEIKIIFIRVRGGEVPGPYVRPRSSPPAYSHFAQVVPPLPPRLVPSVCHPRRSVMISRRLPRTGRVCLSLASLPARTATPPSKCAPAPPPSCCAR